MQAAYETVERLIVALGCPRTVNIELLAHSFREDTNACFPCFSRDLLSNNMVLEPISGLLEVGGCLTWALWALCRGGQGLGFSSLQSHCYWKINKGRAGMKYLKMVVRKELRSGRKKMCCGLEVSWVRGDYSITWSFYLSGALYITWSFRTIHFKKIHKVQAPKDAIWKRSNPMYNGRH